jgi:hypothetical protein
MFTGINYLAIVVSAVLYFIFGGLWYASALSRPWTEALNFSPEVRAKAQKDFPKALLSHFVSGLLTSFVLANIIRFSQTGTFLAGAALGFWVWIGFAFTLNLNSLMFEKRPSAVFVINAGFYLATYMILGGLLAVWP